MVDKVVTRNRMCGWRRLLVKDYFHIIYEHTYQSDPNWTTKKIFDVTKAQSEISFQFHLLVTDSTIIVYWTSLLALFLFYKKKRNEPKASDVTVQAKAVTWK